ncbi:MAG: hypothetical protein IKW58_03485 [Alphaproteobacteria bacterium]|nr:hypothetical protein [Alphaproteobacteria bacterium]
MMKFGLFLFSCLMLATSSFAQILDDDYEDATPDTNVEVDDNEHEEMFNQMFGEKVKNPPIVAPSENTLSEIASEMAKKINEEKVISLEKKEKQESSFTNANKAPVEGELRIGISKGSFRLSQDIMGRTVCSFGVSLKSTLNRDIKTLALRLAYPQTAYAFIFRDVKANGSDEKYISTNGDICYNLSGVPDIDINRCRIVGASEKECISRMKWDSEIQSPDPSKNPYL